MSDQVKTESEEENSYPEGWRPEAGDRIVGIVVGVSGVDMGHGFYPVVTLRCEDGKEFAVHAFHTVLRGELAERRPNVGDELDITYLGKKQGAQRGYDSYKVRSDKDGNRGYDWDREERAGGSVPITPAPAPAAVPQPQAVAAAADDDLPF